jgi:site-specific DNA recombinase
MSEKGRASAIIHGHQIVTRAAIYARYSSDLQDARSIDDQVALCRRHAERQGWTVVGVYADREISGASVHGRGDYDRMLADARASKFAVIIAEDIDRLARKQVDTLQLRDRMEFIGVQIHTVADGRVTKLNAGFKGLMSEMFLDNLALHVRRGQAGRIAEGRAGGGLTYGYDVLPAELVTGSKKPRRGGRAINQTHAEVVRRIFAEYIAGRRPREIVAGLNREHIAPPRGGREWRASALIGNARRGAGILNNELYAGRLVWNKVRMIKDPDTGRRVSRAQSEIGMAVGRGAGAAHRRGRHLRRRGDDQDRARHAQAALPARPQTAAVCCPAARAAPAWRSRMPPTPDIAACNARA